MEFTTSAITRLLSQQDLARQGDPATLPTLVSDRDRYNLISPGPHMLGNAGICEKYLVLDIRLLLLWLVCNCAVPLLLPSSHGSLYLEPHLSFLQEPRRDKG